LRLLGDLAMFSPLPITCEGGGALRIVVGPPTLPADNWSRNIKLAVHQDLIVGKIGKFILDARQATKEPRGRADSYLIIVENQAPDLDALP
jgi:hypothetical protein